MAVSPASDDSMSRRYPGVEPFGDSDVDRELFCGRDQEKYDLLHQVLNERLVVLFARSGIGKSSIINAGLMQPLRDKGHFPLVARVSSAGGDPLASFYKGVEAACKRALARGEIDAYEPESSADWNRTSLWHFIKTFYVWRGDEPLVPVLIMDQFEELFTLVDDEQRLRFIDQLADLVRGMRPRRHAGAEGRDEATAEDLTSRPPDVKVVLSIREEFLADLQELANRIPAILKSRFRLGPLNSDQAMLAIEKPASLERPDLATPPFKWSKAALKCALDFLRKRKAKDGAAEVGNVVEPFQLQLICQHVEDLVREQNLTEVSGEDLGGEEALEEILSEFYARSIRHLRRMFRGYRLKRRLYDLCEYGLITSRGRRLLREESTIAESDRISPEILAEMVHLRLLRREPRVGDNYYELTHDTLIAPILDHRRRRERRKWQVRFAVIGVPALIAIGLVSVTFWNARQVELARLTMETLKNDQTSRAIVAKIPVSGVLTTDVTMESTLASSNTFDAAVLEKWNLVLDTDQRTTVSMSSSDFDAFLIVLTSSGQVRTDDDSGDGFDAKLSFRDGPGTAQVVAGSYTGSSTGNYRISVGIAAEDLAQSVLSVEELVPEEVTIKGTLTPGDTIEGTLTEADRLGSFVVQRWDLQMDQREPVTVSLSSDDLDSYLVAHLSDQQVLVNDDSGINGSRDSMLSFSDGPGTVSLIVSSYVGDATGDFTLEATVDTRYSAASAADLPATEIREIGTLEIDSEANGSLTESDAAGQFVAQRWNLELAEQQQVTISLSSDEIDTFLVVHRTDGQVLQNDDFGGGTDSMLSFADGPGRVAVIVSSYGGSELGSYRIEVEREEGFLNPAVEQLAPEEVTSQGEISVGSEVAGFLSATDVAGQYLAQRWDLQFDDERSVTISLDSAEFDTYLVAHLPDGSTLVDDDGGGDANSTNSLLTLTAGPGAVSIVVSSYSGTQTGSYTLRVE